MLDRLRFVFSIAGLMTITAGLMTLEGIILLLLGCGVTVGLLGVVFGLMKSGFSPAVVIVAAWAYVGIVYLVYRRWFRNR